MVGGMVDEKSSVLADKEIKTINVSYINNECCTNTLLEEDTTLLEENSLLDENSLLEKTERETGETVSKRSSVNLSSKESSCDMDICKLYVELKSDTSAELNENVTDGIQNGNGKIHVICVEVHKECENNKSYNNHVSGEETACKNTVNISDANGECDPNAFVHNGLVSNHFSYKKPSKKVSMLIHRHTL